MRECIRCQIQRGPRLADRVLRPAYQDQTAQGRGHFFALGEKEKKWRDQAPTEVLDAFADCFVAKYGKDAVDPGRRCATVEFEKNTKDEEGKVLSIDAVPAFELEDCYEIPDRVLGKWIKTNPEVHAEKSTATNKALDGKWVPLVKMLKRWNRSAGNPIKPSFLIEVMAHDLVVAPFTTYAREVQSFFAAVPAVLSGPWPDPPLRAAGFGPDEAGFGAEGYQRLAHR